MRKTPRPKKPITEKQKVFGATPESVSKKRMGARWNKLAAYLAIDPNRLKEWREEPQAPKRPKKREWVRYRDAKIGKTGSPDIDTLMGTSNPLKRREQEVKIMLLEAKLAKEQRRVIPMTDVASLLTRLGSSVKAQLYDALETELPPKLEGLTAADIRVKCREQADRICINMQSSIEAWLKDSDLTLDDESLSDTE